MATVISGTTGISASNADLNSVNLGVLGLRRNMVGYCDSNGSNVATFSCDSHILVNSSLKFTSKSLYNNTINLTASGPGGVGTSLTTKRLAIYHIYNSATNTSALYGVDPGAGQVAPEFLPVSSLPSGYDFNALVAVVMLDSSNKFKSFLLTDRRIGSYLSDRVVIGNFPSGTTVDLTADIPLNAKTLLINLRAGSNGGGFPAGGVQLAATLTPVGTDITATMGGMTVQGTAVSQTGTLGVIGQGEIILPVTTKYVQLYTLANPAGFTQATYIQYVGYTF